MQDTLLIELRTEELPPKALARMSQAFCEALVADLRQNGLLTETSKATAYATPRRLAVSITDVLKQAPSRSVEIAGPSVKVGLGADGKPTQALLGFAKKFGVTAEDLVQIETPKGKFFACRTMDVGTHLETNLELKVAEALKRLPIPKVMRWGEGDSSAQFVRPVHGLVMLHGARVIPGEVLGLKSSNQTLGHRFLSSGPIAIPHANDYERVLREDGKVIASFTARRSEIVNKINELKGASEPVAGAALYDEIAALVEAPTVYEARFDDVFLEVPQECLILSMQQHQKYVPLRDATSGKLVPRFLFVANLNADDPSNIIHGNERVLRARLSDAKFFYDQDRKVQLKARVPKLANVVYHNKIGNQYHRVLCIQTIAAQIAELLGEDRISAERAAYLAKADLITGMVGEFPELQGVMGMYYALSDGETHEIANAIEGHYHPRFAGDSIPHGRLAQTVALADKLQTLVGIFGVGQIPTGDKDPFALRRTTLGIIRILIEGELPLDIRKLLAISQEALVSEELLRQSTAPLGPRTGYSIPDLDQKAIAQIPGFIEERLKGYLRDKDYASDEIEAVVSQQQPRLDLLVPRLKAVRAFKKLPEAEALASANKRIRNILLKAEKQEIKGIADPALLTNAAEQQLYREVVEIRQIVETKHSSRNYTESLCALAKLRPIVDRFFDDVMVNTDDPKVRVNRLRLLSELDILMNKVADISKLAA